MKSGAKICVLICAGKLHKEDRDRIERYLDCGAYLVAVDGGLDYCCQMGLSADLYLGDFDSVSVETIKGLEDRCKDGFDGPEATEAMEAMEAMELPEVMKLPVEKDDTDTLAALKLCMERGYKEFYIFGGCGGRLDHTMANIQCLLFLKRNGCKGLMISGKETIFVLKDEEVCFEAGRGGIMSLFALSREVKGVSIFGMKYNLENAVITNDFPIGISNEFTGQESRIAILEGEALVVLNAGAVDKG